LTGGLGFLFRSSFFSAWETPAIPFTASFLMGLLWEKVSSRAAFGFVGTLALLAALLLWLTLDSKKNEGWVTG
jgi:hypothetical protein